MDVDLDDFAVMAAADADDDDNSDVGISNESKSESESELILSPVLATFNSHSAMSGDELTLMLSLDLTSSTWALEEDDAAAAAAALDGLPMIPKRRRNAGGHATPSSPTPSLVAADTAGRRRRLWSISLSGGGRIISECRARVLLVEILY